MLFDLDAFAVRKSGFPLSVTVKATLNNSCYEAEVTDVFPCGTVEYETDPGVAQLFVKVIRYDRLCFQAEQPWAETRTIWNAQRYAEVEIVLTFEHEGEDEVEEERLRVPILNIPDEGR